MSIKKRQKIVDRFNDPHVGELYFTKVAVVSTTILQSKWLKHSTQVMTSTFSNPILL